MFDLDHDEEEYVVDDVEITVADADALSPGISAGISQNDTNNTTPLRGKYRVTPKMTLLHELKLKMLQF